MYYIIYLFAIFFILRLATLFISIKNEKRIVSEGAIEYGKRNSTAMAVLHVLFYLSALTEAFVFKTPFETINLVGAILFVFSYIVLLYVIYQLRAVWTVKLYIVPNHQIVKSILFRYVKHPNYFLNIIPELIGIGLLCQAWYSMALFFPFYTITMVVRIMQEEKAMKKLR